MKNNKDVKGWEDLINVSLLQEEIKNSVKFPSFLEK